MNIVTKEEVAWNWTGYKMSIELNISHLFICFHL
jgi:hypothetical protein